MGLVGAIGCDKARSLNFFKPLSVVSLAPSLLLFILSLLFYSLLMLSHPLNRLLVPRWKIASLLRLLLRPILNSLTPLIRRLLINDALYNPARIFPLIYLWLESALCHLFLLSFELFHHGYHLPFRHFSFIFIIKLLRLYGLVHGGLRLIRLLELLSDFWLLKFIGF